METNNVPYTKTDLCEERKAENPLSLNGFEIKLDSSIELAKYEVVGSHGIDYQDLHAKKWVILQELNKQNHLVGFSFREGKMYLYAPPELPLPKKLKVKINRTKTNLRINFLVVDTFSLSDISIRDAVGAMIRTDLVNRLRNKGATYDRYGQMLIFKEHTLYKDSYFFEIKSKTYKYFVTAVLATKMTIRLSKQRRGYKAVVFITPQIKQYYRSENMKALKPLKPTFSRRILASDGKNAEKHLHKIKKPGADETFTRVLEIRNYIGDFTFLNRPLSWEFMQTHDFLLNSNELNVGGTFDVNTQKGIREFVKKNMLAGDINVLVVQDKGLDYKIRLKVKKRLDHLQLTAKTYGINLNYLTEIPCDIEFTTPSNEVAQREKIVGKLTKLKKEYKGKVDIFLCLIKGRAVVAEDSKSSRIWDLVTVAMKRTPVQRIFSYSFYYIEKDPLSIILSLAYKSKGLHFNKNLNQPFDLSCAWDLSVFGKRGHQRSLIAAGAVISKNNKVLYHYNKKGLLPNRTEKIEVQLLYELLKDVLSRDEIDVGKIKDGILFIRDGISYEDYQAVDRLSYDLMQEVSDIQMGDNAQIVLVELLKGVVVRGLVSNNNSPEPGVAVRISDNEVILWTTKTSGSALPRGIMLRVRYPEIPSDELLHKIVKQVFYDSHLRYTSLTKSRLPTQITVAEDLMRYAKAYLRVLERLPEMEELPEYIMS